MSSYVKMNAAQFPHRWRGDYKYQKCSYIEGCWDRNRAQNVERGRGEFDTHNWRQNGQKEKTSNLPNKLMDKWMTGRTGRWRGNMEKNITCNYKWYEVMTAQEIWHVREVVCHQGILKVKKRMCYKTVHESLLRNEIM